MSPWPQTWRRAEEAARLHEVMSFALAAAVVAERFGQVAGRASTRTGARAIAVEAAVRVGLAVNAPATAAAPAAEDLCNECEQPDERPSDCEPADVAEETRAEERRSERSAADAGTEPPVQLPELIGGKGAGWPWINWVRAGLRDGTIPADAKGGWMHNIAGEAYVVVPECFEAFAQVENVDAKTVKNQVVRLGRHRERKSRSGQANSFRAELPDGRRVDGMVFPGDLIWDDDPPPQAAGALGRRRR